MSATEEKHDVKPSEVKPQPVRLVGQPEMTDAQRAEFLAKARMDEANYSPKDYVGGRDEQHRFHFNPHKYMDVTPDEDAELSRKGAAERRVALKQEHEKAINSFIQNYDKTIKAGDVKSLNDRLRDVATAEANLKNFENSVIVDSLVKKEEMKAKVPERLARFFVDDHTSNVYDADFYKSVKPGPRITRENDHQNSSGNGDHHAPLVGQGAMTDAERTAFLQQARKDEKAYTASMAAKDPQYYMYNPIPVTDAGGYSYADHPLNQKIAAETRYVGDLKHQLHTGQSFSELADLRELAKKTTSLMNDKATLDGYYGVAEKHAAATSAAAPVTKTPVTDLPRGAAINLPPDVLDGMDPHELAAYHKELDGHVEHLKQKHGSKLIAAVGLLAASAEAAYATPGPMTAKLDAAGRALKDEAVNAIPGVDAVKAYSNGKTSEAAALLSDLTPVGELNRTAQRAFSLATGRPSYVEAGMVESIGTAAVASIRSAANKGNEVINQFQEAVGLPTKRTTDMEHLANKQAFMQAADAIVAGNLHYRVAENAHVVVKATTESLTDLYKHLTKDGSLGKDDVHALNATKEMLSQGFDAPNYAPLKNIVARYEVMHANDNKHVTNHQVNAQEMVY